MIDYLYSDADFERYHVMFESKNQSLKQNKDMQNTCKFNTLPLLLALMLLVSSCASTTLIQSQPSGARLYLNGEYVGKTPYTHRDTKIVGTCTTVRIEEEGYEMFHGNFCRNEEADVGAIIGGVFFLFPFLWTMKYKPDRTYELRSEPDAVEKHPEMMEIDKTLTPTKAEKLRELKKLFDEGILTEEEYEREKRKILEGEW